MNDDQKLWLEHLSRLPRYERGVEKIFRKAMLECIKLGLYSENSPSIDSEIFPYEFSKVPYVDQAVQRLLRVLHKELTAYLAMGIEREFLAAHAKNDRLIDSILKSYTTQNVERVVETTDQAIIDRITDTLISNSKLLPKLKQRNLESLKAFQERKRGGMNLSERVWKITKTFEVEMEMALDATLGEGKTASELAQEIQPLLNEPNMLFRRVRDKRDGRLVLSKRAKAYNPGQGIYRSSYKNAMRVARTEINMAYRVADHERRIQNPLIVGYEVRRSNHPYPCPRCEAMKGNYPKGYIFRSNHPQCRCYAVAILAAPEEIEFWISAGAEGSLKSKNEVTAMPDSWKEYVKKNTERLMKPTLDNRDYWILDNFKGGDITKGLKIDLAI